MEYDLGWKRKFTECKNLKTDQRHLKLQGQTMMNHSLPPQPGFYQFQEKPLLMRQKGISPGWNANGRR